MSSVHKNQSANNVIAETEDGKILLVFGTTAPADAQTGYSPGALFIDRSAGTIYVNEATTDSADFNRISTEAAQVLAGATLTDNLTFDSALDIVVDANTAATLEVSDGTTKLLAFDSRNTVKDVSTLTITASAPTIATEAAAHINASLKIAAKTVTYTGTTGTTSSLGAALHVGAVTFTDASMATLTTASAVHITALAAAGGMLTITNSRMISTSVSDCFLTNAGVWTDTACWGWGKNNVVDATADMIDGVLEQITPRSWTYKGDVHGDDKGRQRVGIAYDDLPEELRAPGQETGVAPGVLASFALAALKMLRDENRDLQARLARLEAA